MRTHALAGLIVLALSNCALAQAPATRPAPTTKDAARIARWEKGIAAYEAKDKTNPPPKGAIEFTGASSIRMWSTLEQDFPNHKVFNRGFGGSFIMDATHYADRIIFPYEPKMIFFRAGGNDINGGKSVDEAFADYKTFVQTIRSRLPDTEIVYISMSPAPKRWDERDKNKQLNKMIEQYSRENPHLKFCDVYDMTLTPDGKTREELFIADKLHFNAEGYKLLAERVRPFLPKE